MVVVRVSGEAVQDNWSDGTHDNFVGVVSKIIESAKIK